MRDGLGSSHLNSSKTSSTTATLTGRPHRHIVRCHCQRASLAFSPRPRGNFCSSTSTASPLVWRACPKATKRLGRLKRVNKHSPSSRHVSLTHPACSKCRKDSYRDGLPPTFLAAVVAISRLLGVYRINTFAAKRRAQKSHANLPGPVRLGPQVRLKDGPLLLQTHHPPETCRYPSVTLPTSPPFRGPHQNSSQGGRSPARLDQVVPCYGLLGTGIGTVPQGYTRFISRRAGA